MMVIVLLVVVALLVFGGFAWIVFAGVFKIEHDQKNAEKNSEASLDEIFDGRQDVTFNTSMRSMKFETVVLGAKARGYELAHQAGEPNRMTLMFEKQKSAPPTSDEVQRGASGGAQ